MRVLPAFLAMGILASIPALSDTITTDFGGRIGDYFERIDQIKRDGQELRIVGTCASACTLYLTLPRENLCIAPQAWFGSHSLDDWNRIEWKRGRDHIARGWRECNAK